MDKQPARKQDAVRKTIVTQLTKLGNTVFACSDLRVRTKDVYFVSVSQLNAARRELVERLMEVREANRPCMVAAVVKNTVLYPERHLSYLGNALNRKAEAFYRRHGVKTTEPAAESGLDLSGRLVMATKYCLRHELGLCPGSRTNGPAERLVLEDEEGRRFEVRFRCGPCGMEIIAP